MKAERSADRTLWCQPERGGGRGWQTQAQGEAVPCLDEDSGALCLCPLDKWVPGRLCRVSGCSEGTRSCYSAAVCHVNGQHPASIFGARVMVFLVGCGHRLCLWPSLLTITENLLHPHPCRGSVAILGTYHSSPQGSIPSQQPAFCLLGAAPFISMP